MQIDYERLKQMQAKTGKTLAELGLPRSTMQNIRNNHNVLPTTVYKFAKALNCEVEEIIKKGGDMP